MLQSLATKLGNKFMLKQAVMPGKWAGEENCRFNTALKIKKPARA